MDQINLRNQIIYDGECPFCKSYVKFVKFKKMTNVELINARHVIKNENYNEIFKNYNIDKGMILILEKKIYYGKDAMFKINDVIEGPKLIKIFNNKSLIYFFYPIFTIFRRITLFILMRKKILD